MRFKAPAQPRAGRVCGGGAGWDLQDPRPYSGALWPPSRRVNSPDQELLGAARESPVSGSLDTHTRDV